MFYKILDRHYKDNFHRHIFVVQFIQNLLNWKDQSAYARLYLVLVALHSNSILSPKFYFRFWKRLIQMKMANYRIQNLNMSYQDLPILQGMPVSLLSYIECWFYVDPIIKGSHLRNLSSFSTFHIRIQTSTDGIWIA